MADRPAPDGPPLRHGGPRTRNYRPHVKSGCRTCKLRRIKCDETKPLCKKCTSTGRTCDGYLYGGSTASSRVPSSEASTPKSTSPPGSLILTSPQRSRYPIARILPPNPFTSEREHRGFAFFRRQTSSRLSPLFPSKFWDQVVLQACHHEPAVRHAVVALGSLHEVFLTGDRGPRDETQWPTYANIFNDTYALQQYNKALRLLTTAAETRSGDVTLMACIIFVYFESLRGYHSATVSHLNSGKRIVAELHLSSQSQAVQKLPVISTPYLPLRELALLLIRLDCMDIELRALNTFHQFEASEHESVQPTPIPDQNIPSIFGSLEQARRALEKIRIDLFQPTNDPAKVPHTFQPELYALSKQSSIILKVRRYTKALEHFISIKKNSLDMQERQAIHHLKLHIILITMEVTSSIAAALKDDCPWYQWTTKCKEIMEHAEKVVHSPEIHVEPLAGLDNGIIWMLCFVAIKCLGTGMGNRAMELLRVKERQEGIWNSFVAADVVERLILSEERRMGGEKGKNGSMASLDRVE